jgi:hypothetical protein
MADFDTIYEADDDERVVSVGTVVTVPDPVVVRGVGNVTM